MANGDTREAWAYHDRTKHSLESLRSSRHLLDFENQPRPYKRYRGLAALPLPVELPRHEVAALAAIGAPPAAAAEAATPLDLRTLAYLLYYAAGITRRRRFAGGEIAFRAASCTGALYEIDLYVAAHEVGGLEAGLYHFDPEGFALQPLRRGDCRSALRAATADEPAVAGAAATIVLSGTYWRNAWKYRERTYRHFGWDGGTILANLTAAAAAAGLPARIVCGFVDRELNELLGLEEEREVSMALVPIGRGGVASAEPGPTFAPLRLETEPYSRHETDYPAMRRIHEASSLRDNEEVARWRASAFDLRPPTPAAAVLPLAPASDAALPADAFEEVVLRRGSTRRFDPRAAWSLEQLSTALVRSLQPIHADFLAPAALLNEAYLIVHAVDDLRPGSYRLNRDGWGLESLATGSFRHEAGHLGLGQELPANASVVVFFLADLHAALGRLGNRGYRAANLEAGLLGGRLYLSAYAQGLGATGLTFFDDDVVAFFGPAARGRSTIFCVALGRSVPRAVS